jgi:L-lactate dehydrogenase complex protein LldE
MTEASRGEVALFVTCLIDLVRPDLGFSAVAVLEDAGYRVTVPADQTCCGQPNYNGGDENGARLIARQAIDTLFEFDYIVIASGSCAGMIRHHYPLLLADDAVYADRARQLAERVYELSQFLVDVADYRPKVTNPGKVTYHDACAGLRELGIKSQPRTLLERAGAEIVEASQAEVCCGFGGTFCVKYPDISNNMVQRKVQDAQATGASRLVAGDLGCILNMEGKIHREGIDVRVHHFVELLVDREGDA